MEISENDLEKAVLELGFGKRRKLYTMGFEVRGSQIKGHRRTEIKYNNAPAWKYHSCSQSPGAIRVEDSRVKTSLEHFSAVTNR